MNTLREVARAAGVSTASASRVLSGGGNVSAGLQLRIRAAASRLGYVPNLAARTLATRRSGLIGVVCDGAGDAVTAEIVMACEGKLAGAGYGVLMAFADRGTTVSATDALIGRGAEAMIFADIAPELKRAAVPHRVPCVHLNDGFAPDGVIGISIGRREGAVLAARYLQSLGHKALGLIGSPGKDVAEAVQAAVDGPVTVETSSGDHDLDAARSAIRSWLERDDPPTAIICGSDALALAALRECASRGIPVPESLSLVGIGDAVFARYAYPALSSVRIAATELGVRVAEAVLAALEGRTLPSLAIPVKLIARESTAPPGASTMRSLENVPRGT